ncbi:MAG: hypothetical protein GXP47_12240 [Acidobacteria bacterium]|nr:hypothetical protein [Acidobacteriota bacterium]
MNDLLKVILAAGPLLLGLAACSQPVDAPAKAPAEVTYSGQVEKLFVKRCGGCHNAEKAKGKLILDPGVGYAHLVDRASSKAPDMVLVKPGDPDGSLLWQKLQGTQREGKAMPLTPYGWKKLPGEDLELVRRWIASGAKL